MEVGVSIPTRLRVDPRVLRDGRDELADALTAATTRAVASSRRQIPAGSAAIVASTTFTWTGESAASVSESLRAEIEELCARRIAAVVRHGVAARRHETTFAWTPRRPPESGAATPAPGQAPAPPPQAAAASAGHEPSLAEPGLDEPDAELYTAAPDTEAADEPDDFATACRPFLDEPSIVLFGPLRHELWRRISEIAELVEIDPCPYGGGFLLAAAAGLLERTWDAGLAGVVEVGSNVATGLDTLPVRFVPNPSVQLEELELLASVVPLVSSLTLLLEQIPEGGDTGKPLGWGPQLHELLDPQLEEAVAALFRLTCRVLFLQLLNTSRAAIESRRTDPAFGQFLELFEQAVTRPSATRDVASPDPLVNQLELVPEVHERFRIPEGAVPGELRRLLDELFTTDVELSLQAEADPDLGFELAHVVPTDRIALVPTTIYLLQGLHLLAHEALADEFDGDPFYARGIDRLFDSELGQRALAGPGELDGLLTTALLAASPIDVLTKAPAPDEAAVPLDGPVAAKAEADAEPEAALAELSPPESESEPAAEPAPRLAAVPRAAPHDDDGMLELTFHPQGVAPGAEGYVVVEPSSGWAPEGARFYANAAGRARLRLGLEARARFTRGLSGCSGWRCLSGGRALDEIAATVLDDIRADHPELADRIELGARR